MMNPIYQFATTFTEVDGNTRYIVDAINNIRNEPPCNWSYFVRSGEEERMPRVGIEEYVPGNDFQVILRYGEDLTNGISTTYIIEHPDPVCTSDTSPSQLTVINTPSGSTAMDVMEEAVRENGLSYQFSTEYILSRTMGSEPRYGHVVRQIGDVAENNSCYWATLVTSPSGEESPVSVPVSEFVLPGDGYTLTLRFSELQAATTTGSTTTGSITTKSGTKAHTNIAS